MVRAVFPGTFDPIHFGHINLAIEILEKCKLDEVLFCPAFLAPHKVISPPAASAQDRYEMVRLAIANIDGFSISDQEIKRKGVSYTIDTLEILLKKFEDTQLFLILAEDSIFDFPKWKDYEKILEKTTLIIGSRSHSSVRSIPPELMDIYNKNFVMTKQFEISSTDIRERLKKGSYCGHLVPAKVLDYIYKFDLYYSS